MNDDRKFQQVAEKIKILFENDLPVAVIEEVLKISTGTVYSYRKKLQEELVISETKEDLYGRMLLIYKKKLPSQSILVQAAKIVLGADILDGIVLGMSFLYPALTVPQFEDNDSLFTGHIKLLEAVFKKNILNPRYNNYDLPLNLHEALIDFKDDDLKRIKNQNELLDLISKKIAKEKSSELCHFVLGRVPLFKAVEEVLQSLTAKEMDVLSQFFGLYGDPMSIQEIAAKYGDTRERVRQIYEKALRRFRMMDQGRSILSSFLNSNSLESYLHGKIRELESQIKPPENNSENEPINLVDLDLSIRALVCLNGVEIRTLDQLLSYLIERRIY